MLPYLIVLSMIAAGYLGGPWWLALLGLAGVMAEGWGARLLRQTRGSHSSSAAPRQRWSTKTRAYFVTGLAVNLGLSLAGYAIGRLMRALAG